MEPEIHAEFTRCFAAPYSTGASLTYSAAIEIMCACSLRGALRAKSVM